MAAFDEADLKNRGFVGFIRFGELDLAEVPSDPGVYAVVSEGGRAPDVLALSVGGWFKGRDPSVAPAVLRARLTNGAQTLYLGKAAAGSRGTRGLRKRIQEFIRFGAGQAVGHWGGRYIWQLAESGTLGIAWLPVLNRPAGEVESELMDEFFRAYGSLPFANLRR